MFGLKGRVSIVTGAASGIGRAVAWKLAILGSAVVVADRDKKGADDVAREISDTGFKSLSIEIDVSDPTQSAEMVAQTVKAFGGVDALVHSAGIGMEKDFLETTAEDWRKIIDIDLTGTFFCCQAVARHMSMNNYGRIVNLSSTAGIRGGSGRAAYGSAKGGVIALTKVMAVELAPYGITVNTLAPGAIETELVSKMHSAETRVVYRRAIPMDRYGTPEEVADAAAFLVAEESRYITGQVVGVDGGFLGAGLIKSAQPDL